MAQDKENVESGNMGRVSRSIKRQSIKTKRNVERVLRLRERGTLDVRTWVETKRNVGRKG